MATRWSGALQPHHHARGKAHASLQFFWVFFGFLNFFPESGTKYHHRRRRRHRACRPHPAPSVACTVYAFQAPAITLNLVGICRQNDQIKMRQLAPALPNLPLLLLLLAHSPFAFLLPQGSSQVVRSIFPSFSPFPCPSPPSVVWARPAAAALLDWSRATTGTAVVATFDGHYLATFEASAGDMVVMHLPPDRFWPGYVAFALILLHACLLGDACGREHELLLMTVDEQGDDCAPQVAVAGS